MSDPRKQQQQQQQPKAGAEDNNVPDPEAAAQRQRLVENYQMSVMNLHPVFQVQHMSRTPQAGTCFAFAVSEIPGDIAPTFDRSLWRYLAFAGELPTPHNGRTGLVGVLQIATNNLSNSTLQKGQVRKQLLQQIEVTQQNAVRRANCGSSQSQAESISFPVPLVCVQVILNSELTYALSKLRHASEFGAFERSDPSRFVSSRQAREDGKTASDAETQAEGPAERSAVKPPAAANGDKPAASKAATPLGAHTDKSTPRAPVKASKPVGDPPIKMQTKRAIGPSSEKVSRGSQQASPLDLDATASDSDSPIAKRLKRTPSQGIHLATFNSLCDKAKSSLNCQIKEFYEACRTKPKKAVWTEHFELMIRYPDAYQNIRSAFDN